MADFFTGKMDDFALEFMLQHGARQQDKRQRETPTVQRQVAWTFDFVPFVLRVKGERERARSSHGI